jgi:hypothetical protein
MTLTGQDIKNMVKTAIVSVLLIAAIQGMLSGCAATGTNLPITNSQEATDIWHSYEILPNYQYYFWGPVSQPFYIIGIDEKYQLTPSSWKPVDLTPAMLKNWFNYINPRVGFSPFLYGALITGPNGERIGLWYSVRDWRRLGSARLGENNQVTVTTPSVTDPRKNLIFFKRQDE